MATGIGNYQPIEAEDLLARRSDLDEETDDSVDSFDIFEVGMDTGELDEVSFICKSSDNGDNGSNDDEDNSSVAGSIRHYNISLPGPSTASVSSFEDSDSSDGDSGDSSDFSDGSSGEEETRAKHLRKPAKKWKEGRKLVLKAIKVFDDSNI